MKRSPKAVVPILLVVLVVAVLAAVVATRDGDDRAPFTRGDVTFSTDDAEGLLDGRARATRRQTSGDDLGPYEVVTGPGSVADEFDVVRLRADEPARRIRQVTSADVGGTGPTVGWRGWVAVQRPPVTGAEGDRGNPRIGAWRQVGEDGVLVRPGEQVRLRTRFDVGAPRRGACRTVALRDGPLWLVREDGDDGAWERLRTAGTDDAEHDVRTGNAGRIRFASASCCGPASTGDTLDVDPGATGR